MLQQAGFKEVEQVAETGFNSSPKTKAMLFRARKLVLFDLGKNDLAVESAMASYQSFFETVYADGALDRKTKHLIALGASLAAGCEP